MTSKDKIFQKAIIWAEKKGFKEIKANTEDFETPSIIASVGKKEDIIPDMTGEIHGAKSYIQIALKEEDNKEAITSKWKLFCTLASRKGGKLYLIADRGHRAFASKIVNDYNLFNAVVVNI